MIPGDPFAAAGGTSIQGGDAGPSYAGPSDASAEAGGLFAPFYFGGSGGGVSGSAATFALVGIVLWLIFKK